MPPTDRTNSAEKLARTEFDALLPLWEEALREAPNDPECLSWLGHAYTRMGRIEEGLTMDERLTHLLPDDPVATYNLCCSYALLGRREDALSTLERAVELGYRDPGHLEEDPDLEEIRDEPRFRELLDRLRA